MHRQMVGQTYQYILLCGYLGSGKDTYGDCISNSHTKVGFAQSLKNMVSQKYNIPINYFHDRSLKDTVMPQFNVTPRDLCIKEALQCKKEDPDFFIKRLVENLDSDTNYVICDVRYPNEIAYFKNNFPNQTIVIWIDRFESPPSLDPSELALKKEDCDIVLNNKGPVDFKTFRQLICRR